MTAKKTPALPSPPAPPAGTFATPPVVDGFAVPATEKHIEEQPLRLDGPTLAEYEAAGFDPATYPPTGYAPREDDRVMNFEAPAETVAMVRDRSVYGKPWTADVHPDEVANYTAAGWTTA